VDVPISLRKGLPRALLSMHGALKASHQGSQSSSIAKTLAAALRDAATMVEGASCMVDAAVDNMAREFMAERLPPLPEDIPSAGPAPQLDSSVCCRVQVRAAFPVQCCCTVQGTCRHCIGTSRHAVATVACPRSYHKFMLQGAFLLVPAEDDETGAAEVDDSQDDKPNGAVLDDAGANEVGGLKSVKVQWRYTQLLQEPCNRPTYHVNTISLNDVATRDNIC
jgi:hypothetical protein